MQDLRDLSFTLRVRCTALARLLHRHGQVSLIWASVGLLLLTFGILRTERYRRWAAQRRAAEWKDTRERVHAAAMARAAAMAPTPAQPAAGEGVMRIRRQGRPRIAPHGQKPPAWPPACPVCGTPGPDGRPIPSACIPSPRPHARPHDVDETPQRANELERFAYAELLKDPFYKGDDPYDDIREDEERACKAARYPFQDARLPDVRHGLDEFKACRAVAAALLRSARSAQALRSVPTAYAMVAHRLDPLAPRALAAFREACRYHDAPSCVSYGVLRSSGFPGAPTPRDREAGRSALVRGCKLAQMQAGVILSLCTGEARPVPGKEVCEPEVDHLDDHHPRIGACLDGSKAPPPPSPPGPR